MKYCSIAKVLQSSITPYYTELPGTTKYYYVLQSVTLAAMQCNCDIHV